MTDTPHLHKIDVDTLDALNPAPLSRESLAYVLGIGRRSRRALALDRAVHRLKQAGYVRPRLERYGYVFVLTESGLARLREERP